MMAARPHYHVVGVSGVGMSALAQALISCGGLVSGSDRTVDSGLELEVNRKLRSAGVSLCAQDGSGVRPDTAAVVVSTAIEADNPDISAASSLGVPVRHRAEMLAMLMDGKRCAAITGTSGKSSVTGMVGCILEYAGMNPSVVNGAAVVNWDTRDRLGNFRPGGDLWVVEADESDRSLLNYHPELAVVTNISKDHFTVEESRRLFETFAGQVAGRVVGALEPPLEPPVVVHRDSRGTAFMLDGEEFEVPVPGEHNVENAVSAIRLCRELELSSEQIRDGLKGFKGIRRRLERVGEARGIAVIDDYGHNPAKIAAAIQTLKPFHAHLHVVWRPHGYGPLRSMMTELTNTLSELLRPGDCLLALPVYDAGGTADRSVCSAMLVDALREAGSTAQAVTDYEDSIERIWQQATAGDAVIVMGARDPELPLLARRIVEALST